MPKASIVIVNFNMLHNLKKCLPSILNQHFSDFEVILVDNASTDGSIEFLEREFPGVQIIRNEENLGYSGGNNVGFKYASGDYVAVLNPDTKLEPDWLLHIIMALDADPQAGLAASKILMMDNPTRINTCGLNITYTGLSFCRGLGEPADRYSKPEVIFGVSGSAFVIRRRVLEEIGGFDESFFMYYEDTDLSLRANLAGYKCLYVPSAVVYHQYLFKFSPQKCYMQERNRYFSLIKTFHWQTLILLIPTFFISEVLAWGYALLQGAEHLRSKYQSLAWLVANRGEVLAARNQVQRLRRVSDKTLLNRFCYRLSFTDTTHAWLAGILATLINPGVFLWGWVCRTLVFW